MLLFNKAKIKIKTY